jgi:ubiquinone/menaquinone biosynthesis C-methylase UbiE
MSRMDDLEKFFVNSRLYNYVYRRTYVKWFIDFCDLKGRTLELGCGGGWTTESFCNRFDVKMTAIDVDSGQVELANKRIGSIAMQADAASLPFEEESFDNVVEMCSLQHVKDYGKALREARRVLRKGGNFYIFDVGKYFLWPFIRIIERYEGDFVKEDLLDELKKAGFRIVKHKGNNVFMIHAKAV